MLQVFPVPYDSNSSIYTQVQNNTLKECSYHGAELIKEMLCFFKKIQ